MLVPALLWNEWLCVHEAWGGHWPLWACGPFGRLGRAPWKVQPGVAAACALSLGRRKEKWACVQPGFISQILPQWALDQAGLAHRGPLEGCRRVRPLRDIGPPRSLLDPSPFFWLQGPQGARLGDKVVSMLVFRLGHETCPVLHSSRSDAAHSGPLPNWLKGALTHAP